MKSIQLNAFKKLVYKNPKNFLIQLSKLEHDLALEQWPEKLRTLRTNSLNEWRELREAALFCYFMGERIGTPVYLAKDESQDYDFVAAWVTGDITNYAPVQLKEIPPESVNREASLESQISKLSRKYADSIDLVIAFHLNQRCSFDPTKLLIPSLAVAGLWIFGFISPNENTWGLWGDFLDAHRH